MPGTGLPDFTKKLAVQAGLGLPDFGSQSSITPPQNVAASQAIDAGIFLVDASLGNIILTLPAVATSSGKVISVKKIDITANTVTINPAGAETIDGNNNAVLYTQYEYIRLVSNGVNWYAD